MNIISEDIVTAYMETYRSSYIIYNIYIINNIIENCIIVTILCEDKD